MKPRWTGFHSVLADAIAGFLAAKRALGRRYDTEDKQLRLFDRFLVQQGVTCSEELTTDVLARVLAAHAWRQPRSYNELLRLVGRLLDWCVVQEILDRSPLRATRRRVTAQRIPYLFDPPQARRLLDLGFRADR